MVLDRHLGHSERETNQTRFRQVPLLVVVPRMSNAIGLSSSFRLRSLIAICAVAILTATVSLVSADVPDQVREFPIELNEKNYSTWRSHILPDENELDFEKIPWLTTFKDGILAANQADRPLLLWTMNGHPLGCT